MIGFIRVVLLSVLLSCSGCAYLQGYVDMAKDRGLSDEYGVALNTWTRTKTVHSQFETRIIIHATWKSPKFVGAYQKEYERFHPLPAEEKEIGERARAGLSGDFLEFLFYAYTPDREANDFDRPSSIWTVFILDGQGRRYDPVEIRRFDRVTAVMESFFPYIRKYYGNFYSLKFKPLPGLDTEANGLPEQSFTLVMTSVLARVDLEW